MKPEHGLLLGEYRPRTMLRGAVHEIVRPRFPVVDMHNHLGPGWGGDWATRPPAELLATLDAAGVETLVDLDGGSGEGLSDHLKRWQAAAERVVVFAGPDYDGWATDPGFGETEARRLHDSAARGARGLKVWKVLGLHARDPSGRLVAVDDPRLDALWSAAGELDLPVLIHIADPVAFFEPLDETNERWEELHAHPDWRFWPTRPRNRPEEPGFPPYAELLEAFELVVARHPGTTFVGAHVASAAEDLGLVGRLLDDYPNLHVDIAARLAELGRQPYSSRTLMLRHADRILFGLDEPAEPSLYRLHYQFLETFDESFDYSLRDVPPQGRWQIHGVGLPDDVLRKIYGENARRLLKLSPAPSG